MVSLEHTVPVVYYLLLLLYITFKSGWAMPDYRHPALEQVTCSRQGCLYTGFANRGPIARLLVAFLEIVNNLD